MKKQVFKWLDSHNLTMKEVSDFNYLENLLSNYEEEFEEEEVITLIFNYQIYFLKKTYFSIPSKK